MAGKVDILEAANNQAFLQDLLFLHLYHCHLML